jgi:hypothetical protein
MAAVLVVAEQQERRGQRYGDRERDDADEAGVPRSVLVRCGCTMTMPVPMSAV